MAAFRVWVTALSAASRVRVEGNHNTDWLIGRLSRSFVFKSSEPVREDPESLYTFNLPYSSQVSRSIIEKLLANMPEVNLILERA